MAIKKTIELDVNTKAGLKAMDELGLSFEEAFTEADNLSGQIGELEDALYAMAAAGQQNTKEYKELAGQVGVYKKVIIDTDMQVDALAQTTAQNLSGALGGVASGFELGAGAMGAFGSESVVVEEALLKVASAMAIADGLQGLKEAKKSFMGLKTQIMDTTVATKLYGFVQNGLGKSTGVATKGMKLFRGALVATGIGALVVGVGLLIANFDKVSNAVKNAVAKFRDMGTGMKILLYPITALIAAYDALTGALQYFGLIDDEVTKKAKANAAERVVATEKEGEATGKRYDYEIAKANAAGKDTFKLEQQKRHAFRKTTKEQIEAIKRVAKLNKETTEEQKTQIKELEDAIINSAKETSVAVISNNKKSEDERLASYKDYLSKKAALEADRLAVKRQIEDAELALMFKNQAAEQEANKVKFEREREDILANNKLLEDEKLKLIALAEENARRVRNEIAQKYADEDTAALQIANEERATRELAEAEALKARLDAEAEVLDAARQDQLDKDKAAAEEKQELISAGFEAATQSLTALDDLNNLLTDAAVAKAGDDEVAAEKARKKGFERSKKIQLAMAVVQGIQGVMAAFTAGSSMGPAGIVMGPLMAGLAAVTAGVNVAKIASTKYEGGGSTKADVPRTAQLPSAGGAGGGPQFNIVGNSSENQLASSLGSQEQAPIKTYVVSEDVTSAQSLDRNRIDTASL